MVEKNTGLAYSQARRLWDRLPSLHTLGTVEDAEQEAVLALARATQHFDPGRGIKFSTFACVTIHHALVNAAAKAMLVHVPRYRAQPEAAQHALASLLTLQDCVGSTPPPDADVERQDEAEAVQKAVDALREHERWVVRKRFGLDGMPPEQCGPLALRAGVGKAAISLRWCTARRRLRAALAYLVEA